MVKKKKKQLKRKTYELIDPVAICRVGATLVIADDIATNPLVVVVVVVVVVGVQTGNDNTPVCALGCQARARVWRALTVAFVRAADRICLGGRDQPILTEMGFHLHLSAPDVRAKGGRARRQRLRFVENR